MLYDYRMSGDIWPARCRSSVTWSNTSQSTLVLVAQRSPWASRSNKAFALLSKNVFEYKTNLKFCYQNPYTHGMQLSFSVIGPSVDWFQASYKALKIHIYMAGKTPEAKNGVPTLRGFIKPSKSGLLVGDCSQWADYQLHHVKLLVLNTR
jgi:hypothetical protein